MKLKSVLFLIFLSLILTVSCNQEEKFINMPAKVLQDKIKGGWAGQVIGCTYGGPTEFRYQGRMIHDSITIPWDDTRMKWYFDNAPGLYDDVYMDLTFVNVFEKEGLDAPVISHALAFADRKSVV